jgi:hypothetical protein
MPAAGGAELSQRPRGLRGERAEAGAGGAGGGGRR